MRIEKSHILLSLLAGLAFTVAGLIARLPLATLAFWLIVILVVFYILGLFLRGSLRRKVKSGKTAARDDLTD